MWGVRTTDDWAALVARVGLATVMLPHGAQKVLGWFGGEGFQATIRGMAEQGLPAVVPVLVMLAEMVGSLALLAGFLGRLAAAGIALVMLGAVFLVHAQHGFFMNWTGSQAGEGFEYHLLALALAAMVLIKGSGALSVDLALTRRRDEPALGDWAHVGMTAPDADAAPSRR
jgi:putative oxidoreductase